MPGCFGTRIRRWGARPRSPSGGITSAPPGVHSAAGNFPACPGAANRLRPRGWEPRPECREDKPRTSRAPRAVPERSPPKAGAVRTNPGRCWRGRASAPRGPVGVSKEMQQYLRPGDEKVFSQHAIYRLSLPAPPQLPTPPALPPLPTLALLLGPN